MPLVPASGTPDRNIGSAGSCAAEQHDDLPSTQHAQVVGPIVTAMRADRPLLSAQFVVLGTSSMIFCAAIGATNALLPTFVVDELGGNEATVGVVIGALALSSLVARGWIGRVSGRRGARLVVMAGCLVGAASMALLAVSTTAAMAVMSRVVAGLALAAVSTGATVLAVDLAPEERRGEAASYIFVSFHFGLALGPIMGERIEAAWSFDVAWLVLAGLWLAGGLVARMLRTTALDEEVGPAPWIHTRGLLPGSVLALGNVAFATFTVFVPLYAREVGMSRVGLVFAVASASIAATRIVLRRAPDAMGPIRAGTLALAVTVAGAALAAYWSEPIGLFLAATVLAGGMALQAPSLIPAVLIGVPPHERASALATFTMFMDVSLAVTGPLMGIVVAGAGYSVAFVVTGIFALAALVVLHVHVAPPWRRALESISLERGSAR